MWSRPHWCQCRAVTNSDDPFFAPPVTVEEANALLRRIAELTEDVQRNRRAADLLTQQQNVLRQAQGEIENALMEARYEFANMIPQLHMQGMRITDAPPSSVQAVVASPPPHRQIRVREVNDKGE